VVLHPPRGRVTGLPPTTTSHQHGNNNEAKHSNSITTTYRQHSSNITTTTTTTTTLATTMHTKRHRSQGWGIPLTRLTRRNLRNWRIEATSELAQT
jgi:hypothetical protein